MLNNVKKFGGMKFIVIYQLLYISQTATPGILVKKKKIKKITLPIA